MIATTMSSSIKVKARNELFITFVLSSSCSCDARWKGVGLGDPAYLSSQSQALAIARRALPRAEKQLAYLHTSLSTMSRGDALTQDYALATSV
jgi:hypothetical protein